MRNEYFHDMERYGKKRENSFEKPLKAPCFDELTRPPWGSAWFSAKDAQMQPQPCGITEFSTDPSCFAQCCCGLLNMLRDGHVLGKGVAFLGSSTLEEPRWLAGTWARNSPSQILHFWINMWLIPWLIYGFQVGKNNIWTFENVQLRRASCCISWEQHWNDSMKVTQQWQVGAGYLQRPELTAERFVCGSQLISAVACCFAVISLRPNPFVDANQDPGVANRSNSGKEMSLASQNDIF